MDGYQNMTRHGGQACRRPAVPVPWPLCTRPNPYPIDGVTFPRSSPWQLPPPMA